MAIGYVTKNDNGGTKGQLKTVSIRTDIDPEPRQRRRERSGLRGLDPGRQDRHRPDLAW
jgi:hypothetical protein